LPENFSERVVVLFAKSPCRFPATTRPQARLSAPDIDQPFGENAVGQIIGWRRSVREVSAYSTVYPEFARRAGWK
jgi:hypothetical protein